MFDLHIHTSASDGLCRPEEVVQEAIELGLEGIALTDHDTVRGIEPAQRYIRENRCPLVLVPGIEMNTEVDHYEIHILGYFIDHRHDQLVNRLLELKESRQERARKMVRKLNAMGFNIKLDRVAELARGDLMGRPHIAQALIEKGYVFSIREAFDKLIGYGKPGYVARYKFLPAEAIQVIKAAGGVPVLAHPGLLGNDRVVEQVLALGVEGVEVYYPDHSENQVQKYLDMARRRGLLVTGGSDYHGNPLEYRGKLGCAGVGRDEVLALGRSSAMLPTISSY